MSTSSTPFRWAVLGPGAIARRFASQLPDSAEGVLVAVGIPVATILYWILSIVMGIVLAASGAVDASGELTASHFRLVYGVDIVRAVLMGAVILLGAFFVHSTAKKKLSA